MFRPDWAFSPGKRGGSLDPGGEEAPNVQLFKSTQGEVGGSGPQAAEVQDLNNKKKKRR